MPINTTDGPREVPRGTRSHINTTAVLEPPSMVYEDESPDILTVLPGGAWQAEIAGEAVPLVVFVVLDDASMFGVAVGSNGLIDPLDSVENNPNFVRYSRGATNDKEK